MCVSKYQTLVYGNKLLNINLELTFIFGVKAAALSASPDQVDCQVFFPPQFQTLPVSCLAPNLI